MIDIFWIIILTALSGFFSGSETALFSLNWFSRKKIQINSASRAGMIAKLLDSPRATLAGILIGNMFVNIAATSIATIVALRHFGETGVLISIAVMTTVLLLFGEVTPKIMAIQNAEKFAKVASVPLVFFSKLIYPIRLVVEKASNTFISMFTKNAIKQPFITEKELKTMVSISKNEGVIDIDEERMISSIFEFGDRSVDEIMTPRVDIIGCEKKEKKEKLVDIMKQSKLSKIPVYEDDIDNIIGVVYTKEIMLSQNRDWADLIKKPLYVPEAETIDDLLIKFQTEKNYMAIIIDEFGGTSGLITLEDVLEEIVGEIHDEYDKTEHQIQKQDDGRYLILGKTLIKEVNEKLDLDFPTEDVNTLNGFLLILFGRIPKNNEKINFKNVDFTVLDVDNEEKRIKKIMLKINN